MELKLGDYFIHNGDILFDEQQHEAEFIASVGTEFSDYMPKEIFTHDWAWQFPSQRYVILIYQRHSIYQNGQLTFFNEKYENVCGESRYHRPCFVVLLDKPLNYDIPTWQVPLKSYSLQEEKEPLHTKIFNKFMDAQNEAIKYSLSGYKVLIAEWYADFNMY